MTATFLLMAPAGEGGGGLTGTLIMFAAFIAIFYFLLIRPQRKQQQEHEELVANLKKGDEVVTLGGIVGTIVHLTDDVATLKSGDTRIEVERAKVGRVVSGGS